MVSIFNQQDFAIVVGTDDPDQILTWGAQSEVLGREGNDHISGGQRFPISSGRGQFGGPTFLFGEGGDDDLFLQSGGFADGGPGNDFLMADGVDATLSGGQGNDQLVGADFTFIGQPAPRNLMDGGDGDDTLGGGSSTDRAFGGAGGDTVNGRGGSDYLDGGADDDRVFGGDGTDTVLGGAGNDYLNGGAGDDTVMGGAGTDTVLGDAGNDYLNGGADDDRVFGGDGADTVLGDTGTDDLNGEHGDDTVVGGIGNDTLFAGSGSDYLVGGDGDDMFVFDGAFQSSLIIDFAPGSGPSGHDAIQFNGGVFTSFDDLMAHAVQSATNVIITDASGDTLTLANVLKTSLVADDFRFA
ncbi:MAG: calcium-binding protein [Microvirga sp.]